MIFVTVKPKNSKALAEAIIYLLENEKLRKRMGMNARKRVLKYFTLQRMIRDTLKVYREVK